MTRTKYDAFPSLRLYDQLNVPYVLFDGTWHGPLWTGHCMMLSVTDGYGDEGFAHELFHWIAASPRQRAWPDLALGRQINGDGRMFTSSATPHLFDNTATVRKVQPSTRNDGWGETTIPLRTATYQERVACNAMFLYAPLVGLTSWSNPTFDHTSAAYDFAGMEYPGADQWKTGAVHTRVMPIVRAIDPVAGYSAPSIVYPYLRALNDMATAERFS